MGSFQSVLTVFNFKHVAEHKNIAVKLLGHKQVKKEVPHFPSEH